MTAPDDPLNASFSNFEPHLAASLIIFDQSIASLPKLLVGRRHDDHVFLPGKFVFPGGRSEPEDAVMQTLGTLAPDIDRRLRFPATGPCVAEPKGLALTAIRELFEETGILLGERSTSSIEAPPGTSWASFTAAHVTPNLTKLNYVARALTPPGFPRRYDTHFFAADAVEIAATRDGYVHADAELVELRWVTLDDLASLDMLPITRFIALELAQRLAAGLGHDLPVSYFYMQDNLWVRTEV